MSKTFLASGIIVAALATQVAAHTALAPASSIGTASQIDLTRDQALQRADSLFRQLDFDHDGILTRDEAERAVAQLRAERDATGTDVAPGIGSHTARFLARRFANVRSVSQQEFEQAMLAHFDQMDLNHDGVVTPEERQQAREFARAGRQSAQ